MPQWLLLCGAPQGTQHSTALVSPLLLLPTAAAAHGLLTTDCAGALGTPNCPPPPLLLMLPMALIFSHQRRSCCCSRPAGAAATPLPRPAQVDGRQIGEGRRGPVVERLQQLYKQLCDEEAGNGRVPLRG